jgi:hypothetical protein
MVPGDLDAIAMKGDAARRRIARAACPISESDMPL